MSVEYKAVQWNPQKKRIDLVLLLGVVLVTGSFVFVSSLLRPQLTVESLLLRSTALAAFTLLHVILCAGPLARIDRRFLPLLYNRRHLGVTMFVLALAHAVIVIIQFHALAPGVHPIVSVFTAYSSEYGSALVDPTNAARFPFEPFGALALVILMLMAFTSHDFWLRQLGPMAWKALHLGVYLAYGSLIAHVSLGVLQSEPSPLLAVVTAGGMGLVVGVHIVAASRERAFDRQRVAAPIDDGFVDIGPADAIAEGRGVVARLGTDRIALFRDQGKIYATSNLCRHQGGPLGEGRVIDGCITCPWHGYQYRPNDGCSPPPFTEKVETYRVRIRGGRVLVHPAAANPGTAQDGAAIEGATT